MHENDTTTAVATENPVLAMRTEAARIAGIQRLAAKHPSIAEKAIAGDWSVLQTENEVLKANLDAATKGVAPSNPNAGPTFIFKNGPNGKPAVAEGVTADDAIAASICRSIGSRGYEKRFSAETLQASDDHFKGINLGQILFMAAAQNGGYHARAGERVSQGNLRGLLKAAFKDSDQTSQLTAGSGFSTISLPGILGSVGNKELEAGYMEEDDTWREIGVSKPMSDFKELTVYRLLDNMEYEKLGPGGKIKHGSVSEESYTRQIETYAKMFAITRRDWINDDMSAFGDLRTRLGRGSKKKFNNVFWAAMLANHNTFFTTARTNYIEGATTNLATDGVGLDLAVKAFRKMTSPAADGAKRIGGRPEILLVPPELEGVAEILYVNQNLGSVKNSDANRFQNKYRPVVSPWLSDPEFTGYSLTAWYLFRSASDLPMMVASFLNGNEAPTVEAAEADFNTLGVQFRGYHDFGADQAEYLCGIKSKGAA